MAKKSADGPSKSQVIKDYLKANPGAMPKQIVVGVKETVGVDVSLALVNKIKSGRRQLRGSKVKEGKAGRGVKAQAIRDTFKRLGSKAKPSEVIADLKSQGITASYSQVSTLRKKVFKRGRKPGSTNAVAAVSVASSPLAIEHLIEAKRLAEKLGGIEVARNALAALSKLQ